MINIFHKCDVLDGLKAIQNETVDIIIADPPYNIGKQFNDYHDNLELSQYLVWCDKWIGECIRILKPTGSMFVYGYSEILAHISVRIDLQKRWLIWSYTNRVVPSYNGWQRSHESIIYAHKGNPIFNKDLVRIPYSKTFLKNSVGKKRKGSATSRFGSSSDTTYNAHENGALPRDVINISTLAGGAGRERYFLHGDTVYPASKIKDFDVKDCLKHPTQKPFELTRRLIKSCKPSSGLVVIPFGGSGSEGVIARELGLDFIGFEIDENYIKLANGALKLYEKV